jgi:hypothetical protein
VGVARANRIPVDPTRKRFFLENEESGLSDQESAQDRREELSNRRDRCQKWFDRQKVVAIVKIGREQIQTRESIDEKINDLWISLWNRRD